jgi:nitrate reductase molybdenum cofactor assembly chaperone NarJ/NarW
MRRARTFKALGLLLTYPSAEVCTGTAELAQLFREEGLLSESALSAVSGLLEMLSAEPLLDLQERYFALFDRSRTLSLYLYEHLHGDSRERGQAMVDLTSAYEGCGFSLAGRELPDFLPVYLEFLSLIEVEQACASVAEVLPVLGAMRERLERRSSPYAAVFMALQNLGAKVAAPETLEIYAPEPTIDESLDALDRTWEEQAVEFGVGAAHDSCDPLPRAGREKLVQLRRPGAGAEP